MRQHWYVLVEEYLQKERERIYHEVELRNRTILYDFAYHLWERKDRDFCMEKITESDLDEYARHLAETGREVEEIDHNVRIIMRFILFASNKARMETDDGKKESEGGGDPNGSNNPGKVDWGKPL